MNCWYLLAWQIESSEQPGITGNRETANFRVILGLSNEAGDLGRLQWFGVYSKDETQQRCTQNNTNKLHHAVTSTPSSLHDNSMQQMKTD